MIPKKKYGGSSKGSHSFAIDPLWGIKGLLGCFSHTLHLRLLANAQAQPPALSAQGSLGPLLRWGLGAMFLCLSYDPKPLAECR